MTTLRQYFEDELILRGMTPQHAQEVMDIMVADPKHPEMTHRWTEDVDGYRLMIPLLWHDIRRAITQWTIEKNLPKAPANEREH